MIGMGMSVFGASDIMKVLLIEIVFLMNGLQLVDLVIFVGTVVIVA